MSDRISINDLAEQVLRALPVGTHRERGAYLLNLITDHGEPHLTDWAEERQVAALGQYLKNYAAAQARQQQAADDLAHGVSVTSSRLIAPTLAVKTKHGQQLVLWYRASPAQFVEAVMREQQVIDGRNASNSLRLRVVSLLMERDDLMALDTLEDVCSALGIDPQALDLDELGQTA